MKKISTAILCIIAALCIWASAYTAGIRHAICDSCIWTVECYNPENPEENSRTDGTDQTIYIELDGELWEHGMYQG